VFSYTNEGAPWVNPEWLADVLLYLVFRLGGGTALALAKLVITTLVLLLIVGIAWRRSGSLALSAACGVIAATLCQPFLDIRPDLFFFLATAVLLVIMDAYRRGSSAAVLLLLPPLMVLWANVHASFVYGLGVIGLLAGGEIVLGWPSRRSDSSRLRRGLWLALAGAASLLVCLLNPEGVHALAFPFALGAPEGALWRTRIVEWTAPALFGGGGFDPPLLGYYVAAVVIATVGAAILAPGRVDVPDTLLVAVTASMALRARRFVPLFALVAAPLLATHLVVVRDRLLRSSPGRRDLDRPAAAALVAALCVVALGWLGIRLAPDARRIAREGLFDRMIDATFFPHAGAAFLRLNPLPARLFHPYAWGGYLMFNAPERKVFIDGRGNDVYPADFYRENLTAEFGARGWQEVLDRHDVDLVLWPSAAEADARLPLLRQLAASNAWQTLYDDGDVTVLAHVDRGRAWIDADRDFRLAYPDTARGELVRALRYLDRGAFDRARAQLRDVVRRFGDGEAAVRERERNVDSVVRSGTNPLASFAQAFFRESRGDEDGAREAYRDALAGGVREPYATYARTALDRRESPR